MEDKIFIGTLISLLGAISALAEIRSASYLPAVSSPDTFNVASPEKMVDGSNLSDPSMALDGAPVSDVLALTHAFGLTFAGSWVTNGVPSDYFAPANNKPDPILVFDLGSDAWISSLVFWQYENNGGAVGNTGNAARTIELRFALEADGTNFPASAWTTMTLDSVDLHLGGVNSAQHLGAGVRARYVQIRATDNYFGVPGIVAGGDRVGIGEVRFNVSGGSGRTAVAGVPSSFELRSGTASDPGMVAIGPNFNPWGLALDPENQRVIWTDPTTNQVGWTGYGDMSGQDGILLTPPNRVLHGIDLDCKGQKLFLLDSKLDAILQFDLATQALTTILTGPFVRPNAIDHDPKTGLLAVTDSGTDTIYLIDTAGNIQSSLANPAVTTGVWGVAFDPLSDDIFFNSHDLGTLHRWTPSNGQEALVATGLDKPRGIEIDRDGHIFCMESGSGQIVAIDRDTGTITPSSIGSAPGGRDLVIFDADDADGDFLLDAWEIQEGHVLCEFFAESDPDVDSSSAFSEMLFNGSTTGFDGSAGDLSLSSSELVFSFETLADEAYSYNLMLSSDLVSWQRAVSAPQLSEINGLYQSRIYSIDPSAEGFSPAARLFGRIDGAVVTP